MPASNATSRFSDRVANYVLYRPGYPAEVIQELKAECGLAPSHVVADIASGTGIWTRMLLENGNPVFGVEPNAEMRAAGERLLAAFPKFTSVAGTAEVTTLADQSVDFITAAQAAHWFDRERARREFVRILKPGGWLVLLWNERLTDSTNFLRNYEQLLQTYGTDYEDVRHERTTAAVDEFFDPAPFQERVFEMRQEFDYAGVGRPSAVVIVCARAGTCSTHTHAERTAPHLRYLLRRRPGRVRVQDAAVLRTAAARVELQVHIAPVSPGEQCPTKSLST
jgi:SAM-dependent methyltransferase